MMASAARSLDNGKEYHSLIIYNYARSKMSSTEDTELSLDIAKKVDRCLSEWGFSKNYYHERDSLPGRNMFTELFRVINSSEHIIIILTGGFLRNCWGQYCQMSAFKKLIDDSTKPENTASYRVIPILVSIDENQMPQNLGLLHFLSFDGNWENDDGEWKKLKEAMEARANVTTEMPSVSNTISQNGIRENITQETQQPLSNSTTEYLPSNLHSNDPQSIESTALFPTSASNVASSMSLSSIESTTNQSGSSTESERSRRAYSGERVSHPPASESMFPHPRFGQQGSDPQVGKVFPSRMSENQKPVTHQSHERSLSVQNNHGFDGIENDGDTSDSQANNQEEEQTYVKPVGSFRLDSQDLDVDNPDCSLESARTAVVAPLQNTSKSTSQSDPDLSLPSDSGVDVNSLLSDAPVSELTSPDESVVNIPISREEDPVSEPSDRNNSGEESTYSSMIAGIIYTGFYGLVQPDRPYIPLGHFTNQKGNK